jgi:FeS assembly SUF system protein
MNTPTFEEVPDEHISTPEHPLYDKVIEAIKTIYDPEIPVDIYNLGLIYSVHINEIDEVKVKMTLTSPGCPVAQSLPLNVHDTIQAVEGVSEVDVELVWDPPWSTDRMSEAAKLQLGMF